VGGTCAWKLCNLDAATTVAFYFDVATQPAGAAAGPGQQRYVQFVTFYQACEDREREIQERQANVWAQHPSGKFRIRVTTLARSWVDGAQQAALRAGFDQVRSHTPHTHLWRV
jgi:protein transport protein SEC23